MFFKNFFSKNSDNINTSKVDSEVEKWVSYYAKKIWAILWLSIWLNTAVIAWNQDLDPKYAMVSQTPESSEKSNEIKKIMIWKALKWDSVEWFMIRSFWVSTGWELLVEKWTWNRVVNPRNDLIAGREYILARDEKDAGNLANIFKTKVKKQDLKEEKNSLENNEIKENKEEITKENKIGNLFDFSYDAYIKSIMWVESNWNQHANNSKKWKQLWVESSKFAHWYYQFTNETLALFWITTEKQLIAYKKSATLQKKVMHQFTMANHKYALNSESVLSVVKMWVPINQILTVMHHRWARGWERITDYAVKQKNPVSAFYTRLSQVKWDWLWTKTSDYLEKVSSKYDQILATEHNLEDTTLLSKSKVKTIISPSVSIEASNDASFVPSESETKWVQVSKVDSKNVVEIKLANNFDNEVSEYSTRYKNELMSKIANSNLSMQQKTELFDKLSKQTNLVSYYEKQIEYHKNIIATSNDDLEKQRSKRIIPWLTKLLNDINSSIMYYANNSDKLKKAA